MITKKITAAKLLAYLQHHTSLTEVVAWAEQALLDADYKDDSVGKRYRTELLKLKSFN